MAEEKQTKQQPAAQQTPAPKKSGKKTIFIILGVLLGLFILGGLVFGIGAYFIYKGAQNKLKQEGLDLQKKQYKFKGSTVGEDVEKPKDWPDDIAIYEGKIKFASSSKNAVTVGVSTDGEQSAIKEYYKDMTNDGWKQENESNYSGTYVASYTKGDRRVTITVSKDPSNQSKRYITIMATK